MSGLAMRFMVVSPALTNTHALKQACKIIKKNSGTDRIFRRVASAKSRCQIWKNPRVRPHMGQGLRNSVSDAHCVNGAVLESSG